MERYDSYKDSGIDWIGCLPEAWSINKLGNLGQYINGYAFKPNQWGDDGLPIIRIQDLTGSNDSPNYYDGEIDSKYLVKNGDLLVSWAATIGVYWWNREQGWLNQHIFRVLPNENLCDKRFFYWMLNAAIDALNHENKHGIMMEHLTLAVFNAFRIPLPSLREQVAIADYLESKTNEIDRLITECKHEACLLQEYRKAIIAEAVARGLNPDVPTKNSGIEWIGNIPSTWRVVRGKEVFAEKDARSEDGEGELLTVSHLTGITPRAMKNVNMFMSESLIGYKKCRKGDIAANTMWLWQGAIGISAYDGVISPSYNVYAINAGYYHPQYLDYLLRTPRLVATYNKLSSGITKSRLRLYPDKFLCIYFPVPPYEEQCAIVSHLRSATTKIDSLIEVNQSMADKLREYRRSLISEAITGKFKVPGV